MSDSIPNLRGILKNDSLDEPTILKAIRVAEAKINPTVAFGKLKPSAYSTAFILLGCISASILSIGYVSNYYDQKALKRPLTPMMNEFKEASASPVLENQKMTASQLVALDLIRDNRIPKFKEFVKDEALLTFEHVYEATRAFDAGTMKKDDYFTLITFMFQKEGVLFSDADRPLARKTDIVLQKEISETNPSKLLEVTLLFGAGLVGFGLGAYAAGMIAFQKDKFSCRKKFKALFQEMVETVKIEDRIKIYQAFQQAKVPYKKDMKKLDPAVCALSSGHSL